MKKTLKLIAIAGLFAMLISCSSTGSKYIVNPTPLAKGNTQYSVKEIKVNLTTKSGVKGYLSSDELEKIFQEKTALYLEKKNILDTTNNGYELYVTIDYNRVFVQFSNTTTFPQFSYNLKIVKDGATIATYSSEVMKVIGGLGSGMNVFTKLGSSDINPETEPSHIDAISKSIVEDGIMTLGK